MSYVNQQFSIRMAAPTADETAVPCPMCGNSVDCEPGPALFVIDKVDPLCDRCGHDYAPELFALLELGRCALLYSSCVALPRSEGRYDACNNMFKAGHLFALAMVQDDEARAEYAQALYRAQADGFEHGAGETMRGGNSVPPSGGTENSDELAMTEVEA